MAKGTTNHDRLTKRGFVREADGYYTRQEGTGSWTMLHWPDYGWALEWWAGRTFRTRGEKRLHERHKTVAQAMRSYDSIVSCQDRAARYAASIPQMEAYARKLMMAAA